MADSIEQFEEKIKSYPDLSREDEYKLFKEYLETRGEKQEKIREKIINANLKFVLFVVARWRSLSCYEDLVQSGFVGLIEAVGEFDPDYDSIAEFRTFAFYKIWNRVHEALRNSHLSSKKAETLFSEIKSENLADLIGSEEDDKILDIVAFNKIFDKFCKEYLTRREELILRLSFGIGVGKYSRREIAPILGLSASSVSKMKGETLRKIRDAQKELGIFNDLK